MFLVESPVVAILLCIVTMLCWGSWANTQKMVKWRFEYFYWDYVLGIVSMSLLMALTFGNTGDPAGWGFWSNIGQATVPNVLSAFVGGIVFNAANILLVAAIAIAGISVAFPVGIGLALVLGVLVNYMANQQGDPWLLFIGVLFVTAAIVLNALAYRARAAQSNTDDANATSAIKKGLLVSIAAGVLMAFFYYFVAASMPGSFDGLQDLGGKLSPYTATFIFALGVLVSNFWFNPYIMKHPFQGEAVAPEGYWKGSGNDHLWGLLGGAIWCIGTSVNVIASTKASPAIAYGLGQGATLVSALWGVFIWKEFQGCDKKTDKMLTAMFGTFVIGLALIMAAKSGGTSAPVASEVPAMEAPGNPQGGPGPMGQDGGPMGQPGMRGGPDDHVMMGGPGPMGQNGGPTGLSGGVPPRWPNQPNGTPEVLPPSTPPTAVPAPAATPTPTPVDSVPLTPPTVTLTPTATPPTPPTAAPAPVGPVPVPTASETPINPGVSPVPMADPVLPAEEPAAEMPKEDAEPAPKPNETNGLELPL
ncbi:MAG: hypothetical protein PHE53_01815 [Thermoguttaceae bacterium]|nr:hypothetical protein [Thermoguttaceae bacterium]